MEPSEYYEARNKNTRSPRKLPQSHDMYGYPSTALYPEATRSSSPPHVKEPLFAQPQSGNPNYDLRQRNKRQQNRPPSSRPRSLAYISGGARDYEALVSPSVVEAVQQQENDMTRARSMAAISSISSSHHRQSPQRRPNSGGSRRSKSPAAAASSSRRRQYRSEMNLDKKTESSRAQVRGTRRRLSSGGQGDNSSFYFSEGTVLDEVDHMLSSSDSELN